MEEKKIYTKQEVMDASLEYFNGDELAASSFFKKYALKNKEGEFLEKTPEDMHHRLAKEFYRIENKYNNPIDYDTIYNYIKDFKYIIPGGSVMYGAGNDYTYTSLSNCVVIKSPEDSISGIMESSKDMANLFKYRCGVGICIDTLRPDGALVKNSAGTSTGSWSFAEHFSNISRMIGQNGRRAALMIAMNVKHPDIENFVIMKRDLSKVTGANISVMVSDEFMDAVKNKKEWVLQWPVNVPLNEAKYTKEVNAEKLWHLINESAIKYAEPGIIFIDNYANNLPANEYPNFKSVCTNPCVPGNTWVMTSKGAKQVKDLIGHQFNAVINGMEHQSTSEGFFFTGMKDVFKITTKKGYELEATPNHKILIDNRKNNRCVKQYVWKNLEDINVGDNIVLNNHMDYQWDGDYNFEQGWLLGSLIGDGNITKKGMANLDFWGDSRKYMKKYSIKLLNNNFKNRSDMTGCDNELKNKIRIGSHSLCVFANIFNINNKNKDLNETIEKTSSDFYRGFISGIFDADGTILYPDRYKNGNSVRLSSISLNNLKIIQRMLLRLGIVSKIYKNRRDEGYRLLPDGKGGLKEYFCESQHELCISNNNILLFSDKIGFQTPEKKDKLNKLLKSYNRKINKESFVDEIVNISLVGEKKVYDCQICDINAFDANGFYVHNCGEVLLSANDTCRLASINLKSFVENPFKNNCSFNFVKFEKAVRIAMHILDDIVDLEIEKLNNIMNNIDTASEKKLWKGLIEAAEKGRRTGLGALGVADALSMLQLKYDSDEAIKIIEKIFKCFRDTAYDESINLAIDRGSFPDFDWEIEKNNIFIKRLPENIQDKIKQNGRRNISLLTIPPTGTIAILCQSSSGLEPVFSNAYTRRVKVEAKSKDVDIDFVDNSGDQWIEFNVFHKNVKDFIDVNPEIKEKYEALLKENKNINDILDEILPEYFVTSHNIDPIKRVEIQGVISKYLDHGLSSTINLPKNTTVETGKNIYNKSYDMGCKGVTVYVDGSRSGVLITQKDDSKIKVASAPKRPIELPCEIHHSTIDGEKWTIFVGLLDGKPYEIFGGLSKYVTIPKKYRTGKIIKTKNGKKNVNGRYAFYNLVIDDGDGDPLEVQNIAVTFDNASYAAQTRMISLALRHGVPVQYISEQLGRDEFSEFFSFSKVMARVLKKFVEDGSESSDVCDECGAKLVFEGGCIICKMCSHSPKCD